MIMFAAHVRRCVFIGMLGVAFVWGFMFCSSPEATETTGTTSTQPNIIFIMADDLGYGDLGCYGQQVIQTAALDQMAKEGIRFTNCYAGSPVCAPSRSVLMTGQHTGHTTVRANFGKGGVVGLGGGKGRVPLSSQDTTVAKVLQGAGYVTGMIGKWGLGEPNTTGLPAQHGFDYFYGFLNQRRAHTYYPEYVWENDEKVTLDKNLNGQKQDHIHEHFTRKAIDFIEQNSQKPFFLYLPYTVPHDDYEMPDVGRYADSTHWSADERVYAAMVERLSDDVGRILETLKQRGIDENTIVFFCSDNGAASRWEGRFNSSGILRGRKRDLYEGGLRTAMIVRYPGKIPAGEVSDYPWYFADVLPTLAAIGSAESPVNVDGVDVSGVVFGDSKKEREEAMYWEFYEGGYRQAVRWKNYKGVKPGPAADWEIYDLNAGFGDETPVGLQERKDVSASHPDVVQKMEEIAAAQHVPSPYFEIQEE